MQANLLKTLGYVISTFSVILLGLVAWSAIPDNEALRLAVIAGVLASIAGMFLRWWSYQVDAKEGSATASAPRREAHFR